MSIIKTSDKGTHLNIFFGNGDLLVSQSTLPDIKTRGLTFWENPNNETRPCGEKQDMPELEGERVTCLCEYSVTLFFKNISDINLLLKDLQNLKGTFKNDT